MIAQFVPQEPPCCTRAGGASLRRRPRSVTSARVEHAPPAARGPSPARPGPARSSRARRRRHPRRGRRGDPRPALAVRRASASAPTAQPLSAAPWTLPCWRLCCPSRRATPLSGGAAARAFGATRRTPRPKFACGECGVCGVRGARGRAGARQAPRIVPRACPAAGDHRPASAPLSNKAHMTPHRASAAGRRRRRPSPQPTLCNTGQPKPWPVPPPLVPTSPPSSPAGRTAVAASASGAISRTERASCGACRPVRTAPAP